MQDRINLLVLEDNPDDFFLLKETIASSEEAIINIIHAKRLDEALERLKTKSVDAVILDLHVPDSFGMDTFTRFHEAYPQIPAVIMTGLKDHDMAIAVVKRGAQDYLHKGETSPTAIVRTIRYAIERQRLMTELTEALDEIKTLRGIVPICAVCKKIRDDQGYWNNLETYIENHSDASFSHGVCPECSDKLYGEQGWYIRMKRKAEKR